MIRNLAYVSAVALCAGAQILGCGSSSSADNGGGGETDAASDTSAGTDAGQGGAGGTSSGAGGAAGASGAVGGGGIDNGGDAGACRLVGATCTSNGDCCAASCDLAHGICANALGECKAAGSACALPQDCCTFVCDQGTCGAKLCTSDNQPCSTSAECCGGNCRLAADGGRGVCAPLNTSCRTAGNTCSTNGECCSRVCHNGTCAGAVSFCTQNGDVCASNFECCGGICSKATGATLGVCGAPSAPGTTGCTLAGQLCGAGASSDGGAAPSDAGVPACGGDCCSRACAPYRTGVFVCQPPSGCRPTGEVCRTDADCCGFGGQQGVTGVGNCSKANASDPVGRCDNGNACRPAGAICKLATNSCNAENNCCSGNVNQNPFVCQQDILGIPRCTLAGTACDDAGSKAGQACATSADCCGLSCVPNPAFAGVAGVPPFICGGICVGAGGTCSTAADCCPGLPCVATPGSTRGTCGDRPTGDAGTGDSGGTPESDGGTPSSDDAGQTPADGGTPESDGSVGGSCADYGQVCTVSSDCCNGVPCTGGRCVYIIR